MFDLMTKVLTLLLTFPNVLLLNPLLADSVIWLPFRPFSLVKSRSSKMAIQNQERVALDRVTRITLNILDTILFYFYFFLLLLQTAKKGGLWENIWHGS